MLAEPLSLSDVVWRAALPILALGAIMAWERVAPRRVLAHARLGRWSAHVALAVINTVVVRLAFPAACAGVALYAERHGLGLLPRLGLPAPITLLLALVLLDLAMYFQHVLFHAVPALWRLHMVHHADPDFDVTTGIRFHPLEMLASAGFKALAILSIGAPVLAVVVFELVLVLMSLFTHANIRLPGRLDRALRALLVTPDMHRIHHSTVRAETDSNFGFNLSCWDRVFGSYSPTTSARQASILFGVQGFKEAGLTIALSGLLRLPFVRRESRALTWRA
jgi:sterol desaturase/sphingolipid hydroxylase (fatty acid hydroxylase superfamily)